MRPRLLIAAVFLTFAVSAATTAFAASENVTRSEGFLTIWRSISRPAEKTKEKPYIDVSSGDEGFSEITYAKARGLLDDTVERFRPDEALSPVAALLWLFRTRSIEPNGWDHTQVKSQLAGLADVVPLAEYYGISIDTESTSITRDDLLALMRQVDDALRTEEHESSLYSEKFHGDGTAFGEKFDMYALTAAHRTYPYNTLVKVTNLANTKSVIVRINDRGPFVKGRDMDLSLQAFTQIAERSAGKIAVTFERLGDVNVVRRCTDDRYQKRIVKDVVLEPGIPHSFPLGNTLKLTSLSPFVVRDIYYPDGTNAGMEKWVVRGKTFEFTPSITGSYRFLVGTKTGRVREMRMEAVDCSDGSASSQ